MLGLYIHIPFCKAKCNYCDFTSFSNKEHFHGQYANSVIKELQTCAELKDREITSVFFGGGTPTALSPLLLSKILDEVNKLELADDCELTVEANPGTLNLEMLKVLRESGVNRLSVGFQAAQDEHLRLLGRIHNRQVFLENYYNALCAGFRNINVDIMFALPNQTMAEWQETLSEVVNLNPKPSHISAYSLIIEEGTKFHSGYENKEFELPSEELDREMYYYLKAYLADNAYKHYEISNFAQSGKESRHNLLYWERGEYIGIGIAAHSFFNGRRYSNTSNLEEYLQQDFTKENIITLTASDEIQETMFLGLRLLKGINIVEFNKKYRTNIDDIYGDTIRKLINDGLIKISNGNISLTAKGIDLSNMVFVKFI